MGGPLLSPLHLTPSHCPCSFVFLITPSPTLLYIPYSLILSGCEGQVAFTFLQINNKPSWSDCLDDLFHFLTFLHTTLLSWRSCSSATFHSPPLSGPPPSGAVAIWGGMCLYVAETPWTRWAAFSFSRKIRIKWPEVWEAGLFTKLRTSLWGLVS